MPAERAVLEQAPALALDSVGVPADGAPDMVDDAEAGAPDDRGIGHVVGQAFGEVVALPHAVQPVGVAAVSAADVNRHRQFGLDVEIDWAAVECGRLDGRTGGDARSGAVVDLHPGPTELLDAAVLPDAGAVVERPEAVLVLLDDEDDAEVVERHRYVEPPHPFERRIVGAAGRLGFADRPDAP